MRKNVLKSGSIQTMTAPPSANAQCIGACWSGFFQYRKAVAPTSPFSRFRTISVLTAKCVCDTRDERKRRDVFLEGHGGYPLKSGFRKPVGVEGKGQRQCAKPEGGQEYPDQIAQH